jgi:hypothetical protein
MTHSMFVHPKHPANAWLRCHDDCFKNFSPCPPVPYPGVLGRWRFAACDLPATTVLSLRPI